MDYIGLNRYAEKMGIKKGDVVFISSDAKILLYDALRNNASRNLNDFIDGLISAVGSEGTVIFPTYNWGFCRGETFDYKRSICETGSLGTIALNRMDFKRTRHPIYSFAVYGKFQSLLTDMNNIDSFGEETPFDFFKKIDAKNYIIDVLLQNCFTFVHHAEQMSGCVKYRFIKNFTAGYIDENEEYSQRTYSMFVRDLGMNVATTIDPIEENFVKEGAGFRFSINNSSILRVDLEKAYPILLNDIINNDSKKICSYKGQR